MKMKKTLSIIVSCFVLQFVFVAQNLNAKVEIAPELLEATKQGNLETMKALIESKELAAGTFDKLLTLAASRGHLEVVKYIANNHEVTHGNLFKGVYGALYKAVKEDHLEIVKELTTNSNTKNKIIGNQGDGFKKALQIAACDGLKEIINFFITNPDVKDKIPPPNLDNALQMAVSCKKKEIFEMLVDHPKITEDGINKSFFEVVSTRNADIFNKLVNNPKINSKGVDAALGVSAFYNLIEFVKVLIQHPNTKGKITVKGAHEALMRIPAGQSTEVVEYLKTNEPTKSLLEQSYTQQ